MTPPAAVFPYQPIGQYEIDGVRTVFLASPAGTLAATVGQAIDPTWTLAGLNADQMTVRHLPTNATSALALPSRQ